MTDFFKIVKPTVEDCLRHLMNGEIIQLRYTPAHVFPGKEAFHLRDTTGFPLELILLEMKKYGMLMDWGGYLDAARKAKWPDRTIFLDIIHSSRDANYGREYLVKTFHGVRWPGAAQLTAETRQPIQAEPNNSTGYGKWVPALFKGKAADVYRRTNDPDVE